MVGSIHQPLLLSPFECCFKAHASGLQRYEAFPLNPLTNLLIGLLIANPLINSTTLSAYTTQDTGGLVSPAVSGKQHYGWQSRTRTAQRHPTGGGIWGGKSPEQSTASAFCRPDRSHPDAPVAGWLLQNSLTNSYSVAKPEGW